MCVTETTLLKPQHISWTSATGSPSEFTIDLAFKIPEDSILYRPTVAETLKYAWIQYYAILVIVWFVIKFIMEILFKNQLLETLVMTEAPTHNLTDPKIKFKQF
jgi:transmembrane protein 231